MEKYDFSGWATKANLTCSDGRVILKDAFKGNHGQIVPLVWNHRHNDPNEVLGHALLENREDGVYTYGCFNDTESGQAAKRLVQHGDVTSLSIYANKLRQNNNQVVHGVIREVSLVLAGANPGACIDFVLSHSEDGSPVESEEEGVIYTDETISLYHAEDSKEEKEMAEETKKTENESEETIGDVFNTLSDKQKNAVYAILAEALSSEKGDDGEDKKEEKSEGGDNSMKHNVFDPEETKEGGVLSHADQEAILAAAKTSSVGSLQQAIREHLGEGATLSHGIDEIETLFPEYKDVRPGAPELIKRDLGWVDTVLNKAHKSPISRIRTRQADARIAELRAHGYNNREDAKTVSGNIKLLSRTTDPQTIYRKDALHRDDIIDITDFDVVAYQWGVMKDNYKEEIARAIMIGDGREDGDADKIYETHIRSILNDEDLYVIHRDVDIEAAKAELQGTDTGVHFGDNYVYAEAIITAALYSRENYKGSGTPDLYCTPHLLNVMLLARDLNGRRIYSSKSDLAAALNVGAIHTVEQFEGVTRTTKAGATKKLLGIFVNMADYQIGATKGGELTKFEDFDIDFNQYKYMLEGRLSGALTRIYSAIVLEEPVNA